jgi:hypothetical protein
MDEAKRCYERWPKEKEPECIANELYHPTLPRILRKRIGHAVFLGVVGELAFTTGGTLALGWKP